MWDVPRGRRLGVRRACRLYDYEVVSVFTCNTSRNFNRWQRFAFGNEFKFRETCSCGDVTRDSEIDNDPKPHFSFGHNDGPDE